MRDDPLLPIVLQLKVRSDRKRRQNRAVSNFLLHDFIACDLGCNVWHSIDPLLSGDVIFRSGPLSESFHLFARQSQEAVRILEMLVLENVQNRLLRAPYVVGLASASLRSLENDLLSSVELREVAFACVAGRVTFYLTSDLLCKVKILLDFAIHLHTSLIGLIWEELCDLDGVLGSYHVASLGRAQAALVLHAQLPVAVSHCLVEIEGLPEVAPEEIQSDLVLRLRIRSSNHRAHFPLLVLNHLLAPLGLRDGLLRELLQPLLAGGVLAVGHLGEGLARHLVEVLVGRLPVALLLVLLRDAQLLLQRVVALHHLSVCVGSVLNY